MARIPQDVIDQVLAAHDVAEVIGRFVTLKHTGRAWKALCPFHEEKTPSFTVNPERQTFKCFGCGKGGNVFGFLMEKQGLSFPEAVRALAEERGIRIPEEVAVVGFDDTPWASLLWRPLTVISESTYRMGEVAARLLLERLEKREAAPPPRTILLEDELIVRDTT